MSGKSNYEVIVRDGSTALCLELPDNVVRRIEELGYFCDMDFRNDSNNVIMKMIVRSLLRHLDYNDKHVDYIKN